MRRGMTTGQRVVIIVGLGLALGCFGAWLTTRGIGGQNGWVAYAPLSNTYNAPGGLHPWVRLVIWLVLILVWVVVSVVLLRPPASSDDATE